MMLIPELCPIAQPLPAGTRAKCIELIAMMLVRLVRNEPLGRTDKAMVGVHDESR
jgi:hypothetical protein